MGEVEGMAIGYDRRPVCEAGRSQAGCPPGGQTQGPGQGPVCA